MGEWTTAQVQDRLELAAGVMRQMPGVMPQGFFNAWPEYFHSFADKVGQEPQMRRPRPSPRQITQAEEAMLWLRWLEPEDGAPRLGPRRRHGVEADLLAVRSVAHGRDQALAVRPCGDHLAAERSRAVAPALAAVRHRKRQSAVKKNRPLRKFSGVHRRALHISTRPLENQYARERSAQADAAPLASGVQRRVQPGSNGLTH